MLGYGNPFYDNYAKPRKPNVREAYGNYISFVTRQLTDSVDFYEIWNEWDKENPVDPAFAKDYSVLVEEASRRIRSNQRPMVISRVRSPARDGPGICRSSGRVGDPQSCRRLVAASLCALPLG